MLILEQLFKDPHSLSPTWVYFKLKPLNDVKAALSGLVCTDLHLGTVRKISRGNVMLQLNLGEDDWQLVNQILFLIVLPED